MTEHTMRNELHDAKEHAKDAARATLMAVRTVVDFALNKLDGDDDRKTTGDVADQMTPDDTPPPPPPPPHDA